MIWDQLIIFIGSFLFFTGVFKSLDTVMGWEKWKF